MRQLVDRVVAVAGEVLHGPAGQPEPDRGRDGGGHALGIVGEAVLEVGRDRDVDRPGQLAGVGQDLVLGHGAVETSPRGGEPAARGGDGLEPERGEQGGRPDVPGVGHEQRRAGGVEGEEPLGARRLSTGLDHPLASAGSGNSQYWNSIVMGRR